MRISLTGDYAVRSLALGTLENSSPDVFAGCVVTGKDCSSGGGGGDIQSTRFS